MTKEEVKILSIQFQGDEIDVFNSLIKKLLNKTNQAEFKKEFTTKECDIILELNKEEITDEGVL